MTAERQHFPEWGNAANTESEPPIDTAMPFSFSAKSLDDYIQCKRRYQLTYLEKLRWPAVIVEPVSDYEAHRNAGLAFHRMVQRHHAGVDPALLTPKDPLLARWWDAYLETLPVDIPENRRPEVQATTLLNGFRIFARFDLLAHDDERACIIDWKTSIHKPDRKKYSERMQSRIYPLVLLSSCESLTGRNYTPSQISLTYWFAEYPRTPITIQYEERQSEKDSSYLTTLMTEIEKSDKTITWPLTENLKFCSACRYRSYCERDVRPLAFSENVDDELIVDDFNFDEIDEIAY